MRDGDGDSAPTPSASSLGRVNDGASGRCRRVVARRRLPPADAVGIIHKVLKHFPRPYVLILEWHLVHLFRKSAPVCKLCGFARLSGLPSESEKLSHTGFLPWVPLGRASEPIFRVRNCPIRSESLLCTLRGRFYAHLFSSLARRRRISRPPCTSVIFLFRFFPFSCH